MRKFSLFMLMAVGLLISTSMSAMPERPVPPEPKAPEGVEMVKPEMPAEQPVIVNGHMIPTEAMNLPQPDLSKVPSRAAAKAPMGGDVVKIVRKGADVSSHQTLEEALDAATDGDEIVLLSNVVASNAIAISKSLTINLGSYILQPALDNGGGYYYTTANDNLHWYFLNFLNGANVTIKATQDPSTGDWGGIFVPEYCYYLDSGGTEHWYCYYGLYLDSGASVAFESGWMQGGYYTIYTESGSEFTTSADLSTWSKYSKNVFVTYGTVDMTAGQIIGKVSIYGGEMNVSGGEIAYYGGDYYTILIYTNNTDNSTATLNITGGNFKHSANGCIWQYSGNLNITGGTFDDKNSSLPDGYVWKDNGNNTYSPVPAFVVAKIGKNEYTSLKDALEAANPEDEIVLQATIDDKDFFEINKNIKLNLNGHALSQKYTVYSWDYSNQIDFLIINGNVTIKGGTIEVPQYYIRNGSLYSGTEVLNISNSYSVVIEDCVIKGYVAIDGGTLTLNNTTSNSIHISKTKSETNTPVTIVNKGVDEVYISDGNYANGLVLTNEGTGSIEVIGKTFSSLSITKNNGSIKLSGGKLLSDFECTNSSELQLSGMQFQGMINITADNANGSQTTIAGGGSYIKQVTLTTKNAKDKLSFYGGTFDDKLIVNNAGVFETLGNTIKGTFELNNSGEATVFGVTGMSSQCNLNIKNAVGATLNLGGEFYGGLVVEDKRLNVSVNNLGTMYYTGGTYVKPVSYSGNGTVLVKGGLFNPAKGLPADLASGYTTSQSMNYKRELYTQVVSNSADFAINMKNGQEECNYFSLQDAFSALPSNSYLTEVKLLKDIYVQFEGNGITIAEQRMVNLDLNGHTIYGAQNAGENSAVINNKGTLTILDSSTGKTGMITNQSINPDTRYLDSKAYEYPTYGNYTILNSGKLTIEGGTIMCYGTDGAATYAIDNRSKGVITINGGRIYGDVVYAIRQYCGSNSEENKVIINGGIVESGTYPAIMIQLPDKSCFSKKKADLIVNGGELKVTTNRAIRIYTCGEPMDGVNVLINGGQLASSLYFDGDYTAYCTTGGAANVRIKGGNFVDNDNYTNDGFVIHNKISEKTPFPKCICGGTYSQKDDYWPDYVMDGYCIRTDTLDNGSSVGTYTVVPCGCDTIQTDTIAGGDVNDTVVVVVDGETGKDKVYIRGEVDAHEVSVMGEGQVIVPNGAVLKIGDGGLISTNDILTSVIVQAGGTMVVGNGGVTVNGEALPVQIYANIDKNGNVKTGVLKFNPNSTNTQTEATVELYTFCNYKNGRNTWQMFATPVFYRENTKIWNNKDVASMVYRWDYPTYSWQKLNNWNQVNEPFAGYDLCNNSENGGVIYTFQGTLIGNMDNVFVLPHRDYCVLGNSYTAPISVSALFAQIEKDVDMNKDVIEKTVYIYNSKRRCYEYTTKLEQDLHRAGILEAEFTSIAPMQGFLLNLQNANSASTSLSYADAVFGCADSETGGAKAPQNVQTDMTIANIVVTDNNEHRDRLLLIEDTQFSNEIENGSDALKYLNSDGINLYAIMNQKNLSSVATDNLEGTLLAFEAKEESEYMLSFDKVYNSDYVLVDLMNNIEVLIAEGSTYTFTATPNSLNPARFCIKHAYKAPTNTQTTPAIKMQSGIYTVAGQYLGNGELWNRLPEGVYLVNGQKMFK